MKRLACLNISWELIEQVVESAFGGVNQRQKGECFACYLYRIGLEDLGSTFGFPEGCKILRVSTQEPWKVTLLLESPDFRQSPEGTVVAKVEAFYNESGFSHWENDAAVVGDYVKHCDRPDYKPRGRWWLREETWRNRPPML